MDPTLPVYYDVPSLLAPEIARPGTRGTRPADAADPSDGPNAARLRQLLETTPTAVLEIDAGGAFTYANPTAERLLRLTRTAIAERDYRSPAWAITAPDGRPVPPDDLPGARALRGEHVDGYEHAIADPVTGERVVLRVTATPLRDPAGRVTGALASFLDVTAEHAARAERERLLAAERLARTRAERLQEVTAALVAPLAPDEVVSLFTRELPAAVGARTAWIGRVDGDHLVALGHAGHDPDEVTQWARIPLDLESPSTDVYRDGRARWFASRAEVEAAYPALAGRLPAQQEAFATLPLAPAGAVVGVVGIGFAEAGPVEEATRALATALVQQCAQALARADLLTAERRAAAHARLLQEVTAALGAALTPAEVARAVAGHSGAALGARHATVGLVRPTGDGGTAELVLVDVLGLPDVLARRFDASPLDSPLPFHEAARTGQSVFVPDRAALLARYPTIAGEAGAHDVEAVAALPLGGQAGAPIGALVFDFRAPRPFAPDERALLESLARQCAQALERARLYEAERAARELAERERAAADLARRRAIEANDAKSRFLATMSHELRTPLNAIAGHVQLVELGLHGPVTPEQAEALARVQRAQRHLLGLINDVLDFAKLEAGRVDYHLRPVPLAEAVRDVAGMIEPQMAAKGHRFEVRLVEPADGAAGVAAWADRERLRQVLLNLLGNAAKFTPPRGHITLAAAADGPDRVCLQVRDTGSGIPADRLARIFEPFVQAHDGLTRPAEGTGLGLAISRDLARGMGGDLAAESAEGEGATFTLTLRRAPAPAGAAGDT